MRRDDLSDSFQRRYEWDRRRVCRAVGQGLDAIVDAGQDPTETMADVVQLVVQRAAEAQDEQEQRRAA